jgi:hypothetical protein
MDNYAEKTYNFNGINLFSSKALPFYPVYHPMALR